MSQDVRPTIGDSSWFVRDRFGLFIHWGIYALPARSEWIKQIERMDDEHYERYFEHFDPDLYDPARWAEAASGAGMKYMVVTTKHHDGFCLWDTELSDYKATNTDAKRDLIAPLVRTELDDWHLHALHSVSVRAGREADGKPALRRADEVSVHGAQDLQHARRLDGRSPGRAHAALMA